MKHGKSIISTNEVKHVAYLARLGLTTDEIIRFQKQLSDILNFVDQLKEVDTKKTPPTSQVTGLENIFREDKVEPSLSQKEVLSNAPDKYKGYFKVKPVLEE